MYQYAYQLFICHSFLYTEGYYKLLDTWFLMELKLFLFSQWLSSGSFSIGCLTYINIYNLSAFARSNRDSVLFCSASSLNLFLYFL